MNIDLSDLSVKNNPAPTRGGAVAEPAPPMQDEPEGEEMTAAERLSRHKVYLTIQNYLRRFPVKLERFKDEPLDDMDEEELKIVLEEVKMTLQSANSVDLYSGTFFSSLAMAETFLPAYTPLKLQGMTELARLDESLNDAIAELALEYGGLQFLPPSYRVLMGLGKVGWQTHMLNSARLELAAKRSTNNSAPSNASPELSEKYKDL